MENLILFFTTTTIGIILLTMAIVGIIVIILFAIIKGYTIERDENGKLKFYKTTLSKKDKNASVIQVKKEQLPDNINYITETSFKEIWIIKNKTREDLRRTQKKVLQDVLGTMTLQYTIQLKKEHEPLDHATEILELYMKRDFNNLLSERLDDIRKRSEDNTKIIEDILNNVSEESENIVKQMKVLLLKWDLITEKDPLTDMFEESKKTIKEGIENILKEFIKLNEEEKQKIVENINERKAQIEAALAGVILE